MDVSRIYQRCQCVIRMIEQCDYHIEDLPEKFFKENPDDRHSLVYHIRKECEDEMIDAERLDNKSAYQILTAALSKYIFRYPAPAAAKQRLYQRIHAWCKGLGDKLHIPNYEMLLSDIAAPVCDDLTVSLIKELHAKGGVSKVELANKYDVDEKTIQVKLRQLSGESRYKPLRIGGQAVSVPVCYKSEEHRHRDEKRRFYTPNTMSPIVLQLNLIQVETLLKSLQLNYDKDNNIPLDLAVYIWGQLSDYAKERIREIFCSRDPELAMFLEDVDSEAGSDEYRFMTEAEMMDNVRVSEQLTIAYKGNLICDLYLMAPQRNRKNQIVRYDHKVSSYYTVPAHDLSAERLNFREDEV